MSEFVEQSVRMAIQRRRDQGEFIARGIASLEDTRRANEHVDSDDVLEALLRHKLDAAQATLAIESRR